MQEAAIPRQPRARPRSGAAPRGAGLQRTEAAAAGQPWLAALFLVSLVIPVFFNLGSLRLSPYRVILVLAFIPSVVGWLGGRAGKPRGFDVMIVGAFLWAGFGLLVHRGVDEGYQPAGILVLEAAGSYLLARVSIRSTADCVAMARLLFRIILILLPFAIYESLTDQPILLDLVRPFLPTFANVYQDPRLGLNRSQVVFEHPILFGAFCSSAFGVAIYVVGAGKGLVRQAVNGGLVFATAFLSISGGALVALSFQIATIAWDRLTTRIPRRWTLLGSIFGLIYLGIDLLSNRTPFHVFVTYLTFSTGSAYNRILIWQFGSAEVMRHPFIGIGYGTWQRPDWMGDSIDNFWLLIAMRHGLPTIILLLGALFILVRQLSWAELPDPLAHACRAGYLTSFGSMMLAGTTVHYWNATFAWFMFLAGAGVWLLDAAGAPGEAAPDPAAAAAESRRRTVLSDPPGPRAAGPAQAAPPRISSAISPASSSRQSKGRPER
jgi:hypothetical protein